MTAFTLFLIIFLIVYLLFKRHTGNPHYLGKNIYFLSHLSRFDRVISELNDNGHQNGKRQKLLPISASFNPFQPKGCYKGAQKELPKGRNPPRRDKVWKTLLRAMERGAPLLGAICTQGALPTPFTCKSKNERGSYRVYPQRAGHHPREGASVQDTLPNTKGFSPGSLLASPSQSGGLLNL